MSTDKKLNDFSLVLLLRRRNFAGLLMGDADSRVQDEIMADNNLPKVDLLKFPHHGSKTGLREDFLAMIKPKEAVISVGKNSFGHPTQEALELLKKYGVRVKRTDLEGEIKYKIN
jgi:competence protein ComEC